ncbi:MAG: OsmC family protein [Lewinellaceae bacterium]|nr:OsmC family protein [Lewinellaceae bacterium]
MRIQLERINDAVNLRATNESGQSVISDGAPNVGGQHLGMRPMEMLLASLGSCSTIDVIHMLKKMRQPLRDIKVTIDAERDPEQVPALFTTIHVHFTAFGELDPAKVQRAVDMSLGKYCSVARIVEKTATLSWDFSIEP